MVTYLTFYRTERAQVHHFRKLDVLVDLVQIKAILGKNDGIY